MNFNVTQTSHWSLKNPLARGRADDSDKNSEINDNYVADSKDTNKNWKGIVHRLVEMHYCCIISDYKINVFNISGHCYKSCKLEHVLEIYPQYCIRHSVIRDGIALPWVVLNRKTISASLAFVV